MKRILTGLLFGLALCLPSIAQAGGLDLAVKNTKNMPAFSGAPATGDKIPVFDASQDLWTMLDWTAPTMAGAFNGTVGATTPSTGAFTSLTTTAGVVHTRTPAADSAATNNGSKVTLTAPIDTTGTNTHNAYDVALTVSNATGGTNTINGFKFENYTGDAQDNVNAIMIGTSDALGTAYAINIGTGWDAGIQLASPFVGTSAADITINTNKFTVVGSSGNTAVGGTLGVTGALTASGGVDGIVGGVTPAAGTFTTATPTALVGPPPTAVGSSLVITAAKAGQNFKLDTAAGSTATLPAATGTGNHYFFTVTTTATSNAHKILCASSSDNIIGEAVGQNANTAKVFPATVAGTFHSIQMPFAGTQPSGGFQGDTFEFIDIGTNLWVVRGLYTAGTTPTTPFSTATS